MSEVTVVIPTKNRRKLLLRTLASVLGQEGVDLDVVVVDDGGADDAEATVARLQDVRLRVLRHDVSRGVSAARNTGLNAATSPFVAFLDDDDLWAPTKLRTQLDAIGTDPSLGWS